MWYIIKWILIILVFPMSLLFVAYFRRNKHNDQYDAILKQADDRQDEES